MCWRRNPVLCTPHLRLPISFLPPHCCPCNCLKCLNVAQTSQGFSKTHHLFQRIAGQCNRNSSSANLFESPIFFACPIGFRSYNGSILTRFRHCRPCRSGHNHHQIRHKLHVRGKERKGIYLNADYRARSLADKPRKSGCFSRERLCQRPHFPANVGSSIMYNGLRKQSQSLV